LQVHVEHALPLVIARVCERRPHLDRRAAHEHVEAPVAVAAGGGADHPLDVVLARDVAGDRLGHPTRLDDRARDARRRRLVAAAPPRRRAPRRAPRARGARAPRRGEGGPGPPPGPRRAAGDEGGPPAEAAVDRAHRSAARPPSAGITAPDVYADKSLARNSAMPATSAAVPSRWSGMFSSRPLTRPSPSSISAATFRQRAVSI